MKTLLLVLSLSFALRIVPFAQDALNQAPRKTQAARVGARLITIMGTIQEESDTLRFVTDQRAWNVNKSATLKGHEGHYVHAKAYVYLDKDSINITEVKMPTESETKKDDMR